MSNNDLEEKARGLLKYKITGEGEVPNPFSPEFLEEIQYLLNKKYISKSGETPKSLNYSVTPEGRKWALSK